MRALSPIGPAAVAMIAVAAPVAAQVTEAEAEAAIMAYVDAVTAGDQAALLAILAPEFQIQRPDGAGNERADYVAGAFPTITEFLGISDLHVTADGDLMVTRYVLHLSAVLEGRPVEALAPRLTVFRREGERWLVVAHANFARIE